MKKSDATRAAVTSSCIFEKPAVIEDDDTHLFSNYVIGAITSDEENYYYRRYEGERWVLSKRLVDSNFDNGKLVGKTKGYGFCEKHCLDNEGVLTKSELDFSDICYFYQQLEQQKTDQSVREKEREAKLAKMRKPLTGVKEVDFQVSQTVFVLQYEYAIVTSDAEYPILGTFGATSCVILALYDYEKKMASLAHIAAGNKVESITKMFVGFNKETTVAHLYGGNHGTKDFCIAIIDFLETNGIKIINADVIRDSAECASLAIDVRTGEIFSPVSSYQLRPRENPLYYHQVLSYQRGRFALREVAPTEDNVNSLMPRI